MEEHNVPRQVTSFEFKLIGFLTLKQFLFILIFALLGYMLFLLIHIPYINIVIGITTASMGLVLAFVKYNERTIDVMITRLFKRLITPSQFYYNKQNKLPELLTRDHTNTDQNTKDLHSDAKQKLENYLSVPKEEPQVTTPQAEPPQPPPAAAIPTAIVEEAVPTPIMTPTPLPEALPPSLVARKQELPVTPPTENVPVITPQPVPMPEPTVPSSHVLQQNQPIPPTPAPVVDQQVPLWGKVTNAKGTALPDIMIYIKTPTGDVARILKTNIAGEFSTATALSPGEYTIEAKDTKEKYFFDTMIVGIEQNKKIAVELKSREIL